MAMLLEDRALDDITATLCRLLGVPAVLQDERLGVLSWIEGQDYTGLPAGEIENPWLQLALSALRDTGRARRLEPETNGSPPLLAAHVDLGGYGHGYLSMPLEDEEREAFCLRTLEQAATVYALYIIKHSMVQEAEGRIRGDLLADLISGRFSDEAKAREQTRYLGIDLASGPHRIFVIAPDSLEIYLKSKTRHSRSAGYVRGKLVSLARSFAARAGAGTAVAVDDCAAALVGLPEETDPKRTAEELHKTVLSEFPDLPVRVAVSDVAADLPDLANHYRETRALLNLVERLGSRASTVCYDDWKVYGMLMRTGAQNDVRDLARRTLAPLLARDRGEQLIETLQAYLDNGMSATRAATALFVHPNTAKYRLKKISETLALDHKNLDDILTIKVALMVRSLDSARFDDSVSRNGAEKGG